MVYVDTSVLAAYYCPEALSTEAERVLRQCDVPAISLLVDVELHSALARKVREGALSKLDATRISTEFRLHVEAACYTFLPLDSLHYRLARDWIGSFSVALRTLDALHLAVAFGSEATLLTADRGLAKAARELGVRTQFVS